MPKISKTALSFLRSLSLGQFSQIVSIHVRRFCGEWGDRKSIYVCVSVCTSINEINLRKHENFCKTA